MSLSNNIKQYLLKKNYVLKINNTQTNSVNKHNFFSSNTDVTLLEGNSIMLVNTTNGKKIKLRKNDFYQGFTSDIWSNLNFSQKYTLLHWLQSTLSNNTPLPTLVFNSKVANPNMNGAYVQKNNSIYLNPTCLQSGLDTASILIHEMDHHDSYTNPTTNVNVDIANEKVDLKNYINTNHKAKKQVIDLQLNKVEPHDLTNLMFYKNLILPIAVRSHSDHKPGSIEFLNDYILKELYFYSPLEHKAIIKERKTLNNIMDGLHLNAEDNQKLQSINTSIDAITSFDKMPILKRLDPFSRTKLLNTTIQSTYYLHNQRLHDLPECNEYLFERSKMLSSLNSQLKKGNYELSL